jgi:hypothetical protein
MAVQTDPNVFSPEALADESLFDEEEPQTRPGLASRVPPPRPGKTQRARIRAAKDPDAEALEIVSKVAEKIAVAKSLARIASSVVRSFADQKMAEIVESDAGNALAHVERARRVAMAAKEAASHAASLAAARAAARTQEFVTEASSLIDSLDHEEAHDDAC